MVVCAAAAVLALPGCARTEGGVASLRDGGVDANLAETDQAKAAEAFSDCLSKANVPHELVELADGQKAVDFTGGAEPAAVSLGDGAASWSSGDAAAGAEQDAARRRLAPLVAPYDPALAGVMEGDWETGGGAIVGDQDSLAPEGGPRYLIIGEADHTDAFTRCLDESGYAEPNPAADPAEELRAKQRIAKASAEWAECARRNGYPGVKDPDPPKADDFETSPAVLLPGEITPQALRELLVGCPNFDAAKHQAFDEAAAGMPADASADEWMALEEEYGVVDPAIDFDIPGLNDPDGQLDAATMERVFELYDVLSEKQSEYDGTGGMSYPVPLSGK
jgi:hypothetical protein